MLDFGNSIWLVRRAYLSAGLTLSIGLLFGVCPGAAVAQHGGNPQLMPASSLDPRSIEKYVDPLVIPPAIPRTSKINIKGGKNIDHYEIAVRQFQQQILPAGMPSTTVWSYGAVGAPASFNYPAFTIEAKWQRPVRVKWVNELVQDPIDCFHTPGGPVNGSSCNYLPHLLPVDQTLHWANPATATPCKTGQAGFFNDTATTEIYTGPVPMIVHVHGAETYEWSDGYPEAWYLPAANDLNDDFALGGSFFDVFNRGAIDFFAKDGKKTPDASWGNGSATFQYPNDQEATTLWYHDHTLGMTRLNVYAGPAGFYILRGGPGDAIIGTLPGPAPALGDAAGLDYYEIPIVIQDRSFNADGSLFYPDNRAFFEGLYPFPNTPYLDIPFIPDQAVDGGQSDVSPIWNPEFFGNTLVTNGKTWPYLSTEPRRYRFRFLNGSQSRFLILRLVTATDPSDPATWVQVPDAFWQLGAEQGFLPAPVQLDELLMGPAERADTIMDFSAVTVPAGSGLYLVNVAPDDPFGGGVLGVDFDAADPTTTGQVMEFRAVPLKGVDASTPPAQLVLPAPPVLPAATQATRTITLNEEESATVCVMEDMDGSLVEIDCADPSAEAFGPTEALLGKLNADGTSTPLTWSDATSENVSLGNTEVWEIYNFTADAHPIHIHLVQFQVVDRQGLATDDEGMATQPAQLEGVPRGPELWETGFKDTVIAYPGEVTRVRATFPLDGLFVWHCHILEHEDNEMMRPYCVGNTPACQQHNGN
jgi:FtsP/CotA-like multicopper oxidase with cupredoxin domain